jgi:hypothetical protein
MIKLLVLILVLIGLMSCSSPDHTTEVYHLDPSKWPTKTIDLSKIIKEIRIVPLETKPECLISYISDMQFTPEMIVALDGETLQMNCFGIDGKFLRKFGTRGKGPGEYSTAIGLLINPESSEIILNRSPSWKFNFFNLSGQFIRSGNVEFNGYRMKLLNKDLIAIHAGRFGFNKINCELALLDMDGKIRKTWFPFNEPIQGDRCFGFAAGTKPGSVLYHRRFDYHIYEIFADRMDTLLTFDFGAAAIDTGKFLNTEEADKLMQQEKKIFGFNSVLNTSNHLLANISNPSVGMVTWVLDHQSKNSQYLAVDTLYHFGKYKGIPVQYPRHTSGDWFIADVDGIDWAEVISKLTEDQKVILRKEIPGFIESEKVSVDGNPVLVFYTFE